MVLDWYSVLAESTAGEYHIGPYFVIVGDRVRRITGARSEKSWISIRVLPVREVLNNAVADTDYAVEGASIFVALYSDRLEISSPGTWPPGFSREDFESGVSLRRNKAISRVLMRLGVLEGYGSRYDRIVAACRDGGYPEPEWIENRSQIKVVLRPHPASRLLAQPGSDTSHTEAQQPAQRRLTPEERRDVVLEAIDNLARYPRRVTPDQVGISGSGRDAEARFLELHRSGAYTRSRPR